MEAETKRLRGVDSPKKIEGYLIKIQ